MHTRLAMLLAFCIMATGCAGTRQHQEPKGPHFSILTYNVNWGGPGRDLAVKAIADADADLVALQETNPSWERTLKSRLKRRYPHMYFRHQPGAGGMGFLSKRALVERRYIRPEAGWFPAWLVEAATPVGPVQLMNVHLRPALSERGSVGIGPYFSTKKVRLDEVKALHKHLSAKMPALVLGDFNEGDSGSAVAWLCRQGFTDALREFDRKTNTWRWRARYITLSGRLDHILYSRGLHCLSARVLEAGASDHLPVRAIFEAVAAR